MRPDTRKRAWAPEHAGQGMLVSPEQTAVGRVSTVLDWDWFAFAVASRCHWCVYLPTSPKANYLFFSGVLNTG